MQERALHPERKGRHTKHDLKELVKKSEEAYIDFQEAGLPHFASESVLLFACRSYCTVYQINHQTKSVLAKACIGSSGMFRIVLDTSTHFFEFAVCSLPLLQPQLLYILPGINPGAPQRLVRREQEAWPEI